MAGQVCWDPSVHVSRGRGPICSTRLLSARSMHAAHERCCVLLYAVCWTGAVGDALLAAAVMVVVVRQVAATGTLVGAHRAPLRKLALSLGAGCGLAGYFIVHRIGGDAGRCVCRLCCRFLGGFLLGGEWDALQLGVSLTILSRPIEDQRVHCSA